MTTEYTAVKELSWYEKTKHAVYYVLGIIEVLLAFRMLFKLLGANPASGFAELIYSVTGVLAAPFMGIFNTVRSQAGGVRSVFEPSVAVAMIVYVIIAWGVINLVKIKALHS